MYNDFQYSNSTLFSINTKKIYQIQIKLYFKLRATPTHNNKKGKWKSNTEKRHENFRQKKLFQFKGDFNFCNKLSFALLFGFL